MNAASLYVHIPFCSRKCLFCSFVVAVGQTHRAQEYVRALVEEMKIYQGVKLKTIYLGGGTPGAMDEEQLIALMEGLRGRFQIDPQAEVTIEANPEGVSLAKARCWQGLGFNRVSLGVQSLDNRYLKFLGRGHDQLKALEAHQILCEAGFNNINLDLMYAFPGQTRQEVENDVRAIASLGSRHLSLYALTIEPNSRFYAQRMKLDGDEKIAEHYLLIAKLLVEYGFQQYEVSNFAKSGFESKHNINYWLGGAYIGIGVGAHGFTGVRRYWNRSRLQDYLDHMHREGKAVEGYEDLSEETRAMEKVLFGLRMNKGIDWNLVPQDKREDVQLWINDGFLALQGDILKVTDHGRLVLDELSARLI